MVQCDLDLYKSLQAYKDNKLHIDHEIKTLQNKIKNLTEVQGHLKKNQLEECNFHRIATPSTKATSSTKAPVCSLSEGAAREGQGVIVAGAEAEEETSQAAQATTEQHM